MMFLGLVSGLLIGMFVALCVIIDTLQAVLSELKRIAK